MEVRPKVVPPFHLLLRIFYSYNSIPGLGLHLKTLAAKLPPRNDLHEPHRTLASLSEYEHLHRIFRLCAIHIARNIKDAAVTEDVKNKMRSLVCMEHNDFQGCLRDIAREGGKVGTGL